MIRHLAVGFLLAAAAWVSLAAPAAADDDCADGYLVRCAQHDTARNPTSRSASRPVGQLPRVQGLPCNGAHLGACIALSQAGGDAFPGLTTGPAPGPGAVP